MTQEQKARAYDEAIKIARKELRTCGSTDCDAYRQIIRLFPELKESSTDEKIKRFLIDFIKVCGWSEKQFPPREECIAWLEKQGEQKPYGQREECLDCQVNYAGECKGSCAMKKIEQKPADKVEPKFHEGDWIIHYGTENIYKVVAIIDNQYQLKYGDNYTVQNCADVDRCARLWDIAKDAKYGDVLACESGWTCIFKTL